MEFKFHKEWYLRYTSVWRNGRLFLFLTILTEMIFDDTEFYVVSHFI
jgi:hypothetical protein